MCTYNVYPNLSFGIVRDWHWVQHVSVAGTFRSIHQKRPTISIKTQRKQRQSVSPCLLSVFMSFHALSGIFQDLWYVDVSSNGLELFRYHWQSHLLSPGRVSGGAGALRAQRHAREAGIRKDHFGFRSALIKKLKRENNENISETAEERK